MIGKIIFVAALTLYGVIYKLCFSKLINYIKENHNAKWKEVGFTRGSMYYLWFDKEGLDNIAKTMNLIFFDRSINDPKLIRLLNTLKYLLIGGLIVIVLSFFIVMILS